MSDSEGFDIDDELLLLAEGSKDKKRKRRQDGKGSKRRRRGNDSDESPEDLGPESEEEDEEVNPYPLEGKYKDEDERERLMDMPEIEREEILAGRLEEMQRIQDKRNLDAMLRSQRHGGADLDDSVAKSAKRPHAGRTNKEKDRKLDELKAKRKAKTDKRSAPRKSASPTRSASPKSDMEVSSSEEEDGQINHNEEQEDLDRKLYGRVNEGDEPVQREDLAMVRLSRQAIVKAYLTPWFEEYVKGAFVRYLVGNGPSGAVYRVCEIENLGADLVKPYPVNNQMMNQTLELRHGKAVKAWPMDRISDSQFTDQEFDRLKTTCREEKVKLPGRRQLERKAANMRRLEAQVMTEEHISKMLEKRKALSHTALNGSRTPLELTMERSRLQQALSLAQARQDEEEVRTIREDLANLPGAPTSDETSRTQGIEDDMRAKLALVNEKNRKANLEDIRKQEIADAERKRARRKLEASRSGTPQALNGAKNGSSRPATPLNQEPGAATIPPSKLSGNGNAEEVAKDTVTNGLGSSILAEVDLDLGDF